jgi:CxxC motif-containing protein
MLNNYLNDQLKTSKIEEHTGGGSKEIINNETPTEEDIAEFKKYVNNYIEIDNDINKLKLAIKERNNLKKELTIYIMKFMSKFNIEDLNTKQGTIRYDVKKVKAPLSHKTIKEKILENKDMSAEELTKLIFDKRDVLDKPLLKRIK